MLLELITAIMMLAPSEAPAADSILIPVAAADLERCRMTVEQVIAAPVPEPEEEVLVLASAPAREIRCVVTP